MGTEWVLLVQEVTPAFTFSFVKAIGVDRSSYYMFKYLAVNQQGEGAFSAITSIQASAKPTQLATPTTQNSGVNIVIDWVQTPDTHGTPVTSYTLTL